MKISIRKISVAALAAIVLLPIFTAPSAQADTFTFQSSPLTNINPASPKINGGFATFPKGVGLYIQQCIAPVGTARPALCSDTVQLWVSDSGEMGAIKSTAPISIELTPTIIGGAATADCTKVQCGLFFRRDRSGGATDFSHDKFLPVTFAAGSAAPALPADSVVVALNGVTLTRNVPTTLGYRALAKVATTSTSGLPVTITSLTPECSFSDGQITALKGVGLCALDVRTAGSATYAASRANYPFILALGAQVLVPVNTSVKSKKVVQLPSETTFGAAVTYKSGNKNCLIKANTLQMAKKGTCAIKATAPAQEGLWKALSMTLNFKAK
jgi:hypothetical protein